MIKIALTIDDLPRHGEVIEPYNHLSIAASLIEALQERKLPPVCGFVNGLFLEKNPDDSHILGKWVKAGNILGNHTYSHIDLRTVSAEEYIEDIIKNENALIPFVHEANLKFFRYPFLLEGETEEKFFKIRFFLKKQRYIHAPVTMDFLDFLWNKPVCNCIKNNDYLGLERLKELYIEEAVSHLNVSVYMAKKIFGKDIKHILLAHSGIATALFLKDTLQALKNQSCEFITLEDALSDTVYKTEPILITHKAPNFLIRMAKINKIPIEWPPIDSHRINQAAGLVNSVTDSNLVD